MRDRRQILDEVAEHYTMPGDSSNINTPLGNVGYFLEHLPDEFRNSRMLDLGCGNSDEHLRVKHPSFVGVHSRTHEAWISRAAVWAGMRVHGLDLPECSPEVHIPASSQGSWNYYAQDLRRMAPLPFQDASFDVAVANRVVHTTLPAQASFGLSPHLFQQFSAVTLMGSPLVRIANVPELQGSLSFEDYTQLRLHILTELMRVLRPNGTLVLNQVFLMKPSNWNIRMPLIPVGHPSSRAVQRDADLAVFPFEPQVVSNAIQAFRQEVERLRR